MKAKKINLLLVGLSLLTLCSCSNSVSIKEGDVVYLKDKIASKSFEGLGVEWGVYEDTNKLAKNAWSKITSAVDRLNPKLVRCMTNFEWIVKDFDNKGTKDNLDDDTWSYDFDNKYMINACDILDYCYAHDIDVAFGIWNVIGKADESDDWGMIRNASSDIRWAKMATDLMEYLVKIKGYTNIKWFVNTNEPNYSGSYGSSKNYFNTYALWEQGVKNLKDAFAKRNITGVDVVGGDTTGLKGSSEYLPNIARNLSDKVYNYGIHMYVSNFDIDNANLQKNLSALYKSVCDIDNELGKSKSLYIWEAGLLDGKNTETDCNRYIANYSYGIRMADYTIQSILAGVNGIVYWDLDDAQHFMYTEKGTNAKEWGMFSTLNDASPLYQELRPWYHSSTLLTNLLERDSLIYGSNELETSERSLGVISKDHKDGGIVYVNRGTKAVTKNFRIEEKINNEDNKVYAYIFNEQSLRLDSNGYVVPNFEFEGSLNDFTKMEVSPATMVVLSTRRL